MPNIIIREQDLTLAGPNANSTDIVYVIGFPGLVSVVTTLPDTDGEEHVVYQTGSGTFVYKEWNGTAFVDMNPQPYVFRYPNTEGSPYFAMNPWAPANIPTLCTSIAEFEATFGEVPLIFATAQAYPSGKFSASATVTDNMYAVGDLDKSYIYAKELLNLGLPVLYEAVVATTAGSPGTTTTPAVTQIYTNMSAENDVFTNLADKGEYSVKYITSGAYPTYEYGLTTDNKANVIVTKMINAAQTRGDAVALIDHTNKPDRKLYPFTDTSTLYYAVKTGDYAITSTYASMFTPWATYNCPTSVGQQTLPGSFGYLASLAQAIQTNANWLAMAGVSRGIVPNLVSLNTTTKLTNAIADAYQPRTGMSINPITIIKPYGHVIWGNRTLKNNVQNLTATSYLNVRNLVSDIKKLVYSAALSLMYEHNSDVLWSRFKAMIVPTLNQMTTGYGIAGYQVIRKPTTEKGKLVADIKLYPVYAVEDFDISVIMTDEEVTVE